MPRSDASLSPTSLPQMATPYKPPQKQGVEESNEVAVHRIRITLTSRNVSSLEKGTWKDARADWRVSGPEAIARAVRGDGLPIMGVASATSGISRA